MSIIADVVRIARAEQTIRTEARGHLVNPAPPRSQRFVVVQNDL